MIVAFPGLLLLVTLYHSYMYMNLNATLLHLYKDVDIKIFNNKNVVDNKNEKDKHGQSAS